ncbi:MAG TPA: glycosyltransferase [Bryobacteraceae bacterium]|nr:glycosyltransferase [Bryobacteraceae bacterium]
MKRDSASTKNLRVLVLSRAYPNNVTELMGLWVQGVVRQCARFCEVKVISPVAWCPPVPGMPENYARHRRVLRRQMDGPVEVFHPRFLLGPGYSTHNFEWLLYYGAIRGMVQRLRRDFPFDLIHAHFTYPDGVVAAQLGRRYGVPVVVTEQNPWGPWLNKYPKVRDRSIWAARQSARHIAISRSVRSTIEHFAGKLGNLAVIPDGVDGSEFSLPADQSGRIPDQIVFAGAIRPVKGVDILLRAMRVLADAGRRVNLVLVGEAFFGTYRQEELRLRQMVIDLNLQERVRFAGKQPLPELVRYMQRSAALILPSRAESLGMVLVEALACGTPVVATRCGGPEDIVTENVGVLVPPEDPAALARGIEQVLDHPGDYDPATLRAHALRNFGLESVGDRMREVYLEALAHPHGEESQATAVAGGAVAG